MQIGADNYFYIKYKRFKWFRNENILHIHASENNIQCIRTFNVHISIDIHKVKRAYTQIRKLFLIWLYK